MEVLDRMATVSPDGRAVVFTVTIRDRDVECTIARDALEEYFWLPHDADTTRVLRTFENGRKRIAAVAQRKSLVHPGQPVRLSGSDFATKR
ncbi:DUF1488 family protein [Paraburkholderia sp. DHOC27]|uniref:DUF1488 family protein n=1 Tax=Paraburkholderia sp. DHOC27 TaxID=2303330 RepID=UPI000E3C6BA3|nr:DUF1488 family protein [Paraburkholderia sp. DHOC27]RFU44534.1 DUF1488 family protein [Paraburkholderia sp. DHOC27]